jgi:hypothetical protein
MRANVIFPQGQNAIGRGSKALNPGGAGAKPLRPSLLPLRKSASSHNACIIANALTDTGLVPICRLLVINRAIDAKSVFGCDSDATRVV